MDIMNDSDWNKLKEDSMIAQLHFDLAMSSPQSYTVEEVREITSELAGNSDAIEDAMRADFRSMSPEEQKRMMEMLAESGTESREWWESILLKDD